MNIAHIAPFAPSQCGLYEAARDMSKADVLAGHQVYFVDAGIPNKDGRAPSKVGAVDERCGFKLVTASPETLNEADIIIMHTGVYDNWLVKNQAPILWMIHGKPLDCYRPEQNGDRASYSLYKDVMSWKRAKKAIYFWEEFKPFWTPIIDESKHEIFDYPVIDQGRFVNTGTKYTIQNPGTYNVLICDSIRADIDMFELTICCIEAAKQIPGIKFHFFATELPLKNCLNDLYLELKKYNGLGDVVGRVTNMEDVYRSMDLTFSPNRIINRCVAESLCCGVPVLSELGCKVANYTCYVPNPKKVVEALKTFVNDFKSNKIDKTKILKTAENFSLENYSKRMNKIYEEVLK
jgi:hypothetical protein